MKIDGDFSQMGTGHNPCSCDPPDLYSLIFGVCKCLSLGVETGVSDQMQAGSSLDTDSNPGPNVAKAHWPH